MCYLTPFNGIILKSKISLFGQKYQILVKERSDFYPFDPPEFFWNKVFFYFPVNLGVVGQKKS